MNKNCALTAQPAPLPVSLTSGSIHSLVYSNSILSCVQKFTYNTEEEFQQALVDLANDPTYSYVGPNMLLLAHSVPNDRYFQGNSGMGRSYDDLWNLKISHCDKAWEVATGKNVIVAVIDSGVDFSHPDAPGSFVNTKEIPNNGIDDDKNGFVDDVNGWDFVLNKNGSSLDEAGHGTHVAGIIAAKANNSMGIVGIAYDAKILSLRVLDHLNRGSEENVAKAVVYAAKMGARVINISLGGTGESMIIQKALQEAKAMGAVIVDSSGNDHVDASNIFPARYDETITVGSVESDGKTSSYFSNFGSVIDVVAGGGGDASAATTSSANFNILSLLSSSVAEAVGQGFLIQDPNSSYTLKVGTSMAAPVVAGIAALMISANPSLSPDQVKTALTSTAIHLGTDGKNDTYGNGLVDAYAATKLASTGDIPDAGKDGGGSFFGCNAALTQFSSIFGFLMLLMLTLIVILKKDYPEKKVSRRKERDLESTLL